MSHVSVLLSQYHELLTQTIGKTKKKLKCFRNIGPVLSREIFDCIFASHFNGSRILAQNQLLLKKNTEPHISAFGLKFIKTNQLPSDGSSFTPIIIYFF